MRKTIGCLLLTIAFFALGCGGGSAVDGGSPTSGAVASPSSSTPSILHRYLTFRNVALYVSDENGVLPALAASEGTLFFETTSDQGGKVRGYSAGSFFYTPPQDFVGTDSFRFTLSRHQDQTEGRVEIQVQEVFQDFPSTSMEGTGNSPSSPPATPKSLHHICRPKSPGAP